MSYVAVNVCPTGKKLAGRTRSLWVSDCSLETARPVSGLMLHTNVNSEAPSAAAQAVRENTQGVSGSHSANEG
jgi:hypothetical protein